MIRRGVLQALAGVLVGSRLAAKLAPPIAWVDEPAGPVQHYYLRQPGAAGLLLRRDRLCPLTYTFDPADPYGKPASYYMGDQWKLPAKPPGK